MKLIRRDGNKIRFDKWPRLDAWLEAHEGTLITALWILCILVWFWGALV